MKRVLIFILTGIATILCFQAQGGTYSGVIVENNIEIYQISTPEDLIDLGNTPEDYGKHFCLVEDIDLAGYSFLRAIIAPDKDDINSGPQAPFFSGCFDGKNHVIRNLTINTQGNGNDYLGLFGCIDQGTVVNLGVENATIIGGFNSNSLGGLCGYPTTGSKIFQCYAMGTICSEAGSFYLGGLCGESNATIEECFANVNVTGGGSPVYYGYLGGLCGINRGIIENSYAQGNVTGGGTQQGEGESFLGGLCGANGGTIMNCYATGCILSQYDPPQENYKGYIGVLLGENVATISTSFYDSSINIGLLGVGRQIEDPSGVIGLSTDEMKKVNNFTLANWDFSSIWWMVSNDYPRLQWQIIVVPSTVDVEPDTLNKKSNGQWITAYITLPDGYNVTDIVPASINIVKIEGESCPSEYGQSADLSFTPQVGDRDEDGIPDLTVKFDRQTLVNVLCIDDFSITIEGNLSSGLKFSGTDKIRVIDRGK